MKFKFDPNQDYQLDAIASIVDIFDGQPNRPLNIEFQRGGIPAVPNELDLSNGQLLENVRQIQEENGIYVDEGRRDLE